MVNVDATSYYNLRAGIDLRQNGPEIAFLGYYIDLEIRTNSFIIKFAIVILKGAGLIRPLCTGICYNI